MGKREFTEAEIRAIIDDLNALEPAQREGMLELARLLATKPVDEAAVVQVAQGLGIAEDDIAVLLGRGGGKAHG